MNRFYFADTARGTYAIGMNWDNSVSDLFALTSDDWDGDPVTVAGERVVPWGPDNDFPVNVRSMLERNNLGPGVLDRKVGLLYGQGPLLYTEEFTDGQPSRRWTQDAEVQEWLDTWDYRGYIRQCLVEYTRLNGHFTKYVMGKGNRIGRPWVNQLTCEPSADCRLIWPQNDRRRLDAVTHILVGHFDGYRRQSYRKYPVMGTMQAERAAAAMQYHCLRSFGRNFYAMSSFTGSMPWLRNANDLPEIIRRLNENLIAAAYIVHCPQEYWAAKRAAIEEQHPEWQEADLRKEMERMRRELTQTIAEVMSGKENAGKFFQCVDFIDPSTGTQQKWAIEPIEMNIDKYIDAQAKISRIADSSTTSGFGLSPALANIIIDGKSDSGSQMLYALKIFYGADTQIPEEIALEGINRALRINFPDKRVRMGLYRQAINREENLTASARMTNNL